LEKALKFAKEIEGPTEVFLNESTVEAAQLGIELTENLQQLVVSGELEKVTKEVEKEAGCSEVDASEAGRGNIDSLHTANIIDKESSTTFDSHSTSASLSTSTLTSSDMDDIPLDRVYAKLQKRLSSSPSTKPQKSLIMIPLFLCILLLKKGYMICNKEGSMLV